MVQSGFHASYQSRRDFIPLDCERKIIMTYDATQTTWASLVSLWTSIARRPENDAPGSLLTFIESVRAALDSPRAFAVVAGRYGPDADDPIGGWKVIDVIHASETPPEVLEVVSEYASDRNNLLDDPATVRLVNGTGLRVFRRADLMDESDGASVPSAKLVEKTGVGDRIVSALPVSDWAEVYFGFDRLAGAEAFTDADVEFVRNALQGLAWLGRNVALCYGLMSDRGPFAPREREALSLLLDGMSEKQVAAAMGLTKASAHQYVVSIYRKLGVRSRGELTALWIHRGERPTKS